MARMLTRNLTYGFLGIAAILLSFVIAGCDDDNGPNNPNVEVIPVNARNYRFEPAIITIDSTDATTLRVTSLDELHTFTIDQLGINIEIPGGASRTVDLSAVPDGIYPFYCAISNHRQLGMVGTLTIDRRP